jgi:hypothetical protein
VALVERDFIGICQLGLHPSKSMIESAKSPRLG